MYVLPISMNTAQQIWEQALKDPEDWLPKHVSELNNPLVRWQVKRKHLHILIFLAKDRRVRHRERNKPTLE